MIKKKDLERLKHNSSILYDISKNVRILRLLAWDKSVRSSFFNSKFEKIPRVEYPSFDSSDLKSNLKKVKENLGDTIYDRWLKKKSRSFFSIKTSSSCRIKTIS